MLCSLSLWECVARSTEVWQHLVDEVKLPSGYTSVDYDALSLRARGYSGWGGIYLPMPPNVFPLLSGSALLRQEEDPNFKLYVDALLVQHFAIFLAGESVTCAVVYI